MRSWPKPNWTGCGIDSNKLADPYKRPVNGWAPGRINGMETAGSLITGSKQAGEKSKSAMI